MGLIAISPYTAPLHAAEWHAAPTGSPAGAGTMAQPWDLVTALAGGPTRGEVQPGDTLFLRGGLYRGRYVSRLRGSPSAPVTVRSAPGEWAVIDGFATTTLAQPIDATAQTLMLTDPTHFPNNAPALIDKEQVYLLHRSPTGEGNPYDFVQRGAGGTTAASHAAGAEVVLGGNVLTVNGADAVYRDFEVMNSDPVRVFNPHNRANPDRWRGVGVWHNGPRTKLVNLVVHDCQTGIFVTPAVAGGEVAGCLVFNNGTINNGGGHGPGLYVQGSSTTTRTKISAVAWNNFNLGIKLESQTADTKGLDVFRCVAWNNGQPAGQAHPALLIGANAGAADSCTVTESVFWSRYGGSLADIGYVGQNGAVTVTGNAFLGHAAALTVNRWTPLTVTDNLISCRIAGGILVNYRKSAGQAGLWDRNRYEVGANWMVDGARHQTFAGWKSATGYDAAGTWSAGGTALDVRVLPNEHEPGRATITVYNRGGTATAAAVDLSRAGLGPGQRYEIRSCQDWPAVVLTGTFNAASPTVTLPLTGTAVRQPVATPNVVASTLPEFGVFVLWPLAAAPVDPNLAVAKAELSAWLLKWEPYGASRPEFAGLFAEVTAAIKALR